MPNIPTEIGGVITLACILNHLNFIGRHFWVPRNSSIHEFWDSRIGKCSVGVGLTFFSVPLHHQTGSNNLLSPFLILLCVTAQSNDLITSLCSRRTLSQFWSFKIRRTTFLNYIKFADLLILRLWNCEKFRRVASTIGFLTEIPKWSTLRMLKNGKLKVSLPVFQEPIGLNAFYSKPGDIVQLGGTGSLEPASLKIPI